MQPPSMPPLDLPQSRLSGLTVIDQRRLRRRLDAARRRRDPRAAQRAAEEIAAEIEAAEERLRRRQDAVPRLSYPADLPISQHRDRIGATIGDHQVVIVAGDTGSGKTTQLPKICLELGRGIRGMIGHTQPRRIAARTVAERIAEELCIPLGEAVGYQVRFTGRVGDTTLVKLMTDGILLAETQRDPLLLGYDTLVIDEAHERSLNIDFILGYLKQLLPRRPDLKVVITSATIDPARFSRHFDGAPVVEVSGRTYPVEVRYRPLVLADAPGEDDSEIVRDQVQGICDAVDELCAEGSGDILVFLSGEREIRDTADALRRRYRADTQVLPLYARLSAAEQHRVFEPHAGRRIVLATNVAETSLTVPGISYVVDPGTARISRYSQRLKVQRLPIEPISQASANQRTGRCGRTAPGICIRLYSEADFSGRPEFTEPEILRTNLASVILQMTALDLGDVAGFPFVEPPDRRQINDGVTLLVELGAIAPAPAGDGRRRLTPLGARLAKLPIDPRLGRMVLEAERNGCIREVLVIAAALSIQDPRERPTEHRQAADQRHARFADPGSDFLTYLNLWQYLQEQQRQLSSSQFRKLCRNEFLNYLRVREWQDLDSQLRQVVKGMGIAVNREPADPDRIHISVLAGLLSHLGLKDIEKREYIGARGGRFGIFPGSALSGTSPRWVMAAELVETSRLWARVVARIEPEWAERLAGHLVKRGYSEPHWDADQGAVMAMEKVTLYGLPLVPARKVHYGRIDPALSRELFIRHALVEGDWTTRHGFFHHNRALLDEVDRLQARTRRRDLLVDDETLFAFYDQRVGAEVTSARQLDAWWNRVRRTEPELLTFDRAMLLTEAATDLDPADYPDVWHQGDLSLPLTYEFEPGSDTDGVTVHIPLAVLNQVRDEGFDWHIPGLREELVTALIRYLPKAVRRNFVPVADHARAVLARATPGEAALLDVLQRELHRLTGVAVARGDWATANVPGHLKINFRVTDDSGTTVAQGRDLPALRHLLAARFAEVAAEISDGVVQAGLTAWPARPDSPATLAKVVQRRRAGHSVTAYPALVDEADSVAVRLFPTEAEQARAMWAGTRRLLLLEVPTPVPALSTRLSNQVKLGLTRYPYGTVPDLLVDCVSAAMDAIVERHGGPAWDEEGYRRLRDAAWAELTDTTAEIVIQVEKVIAAAHRVRSRLAAPAAPALEPSIADMRAQLVGLIQPGFVTATGPRHLADLPRYLTAIDRRLDKLAANPARDRAWMQRVAEVGAECRDLLAQLPPDRRETDEVKEIRWMIEELRVSFFAQDLRTRYPISDVRVYRVLDRLR